MHVENAYSSERAEEIMLAVRSFMRHLATKISERLNGEVFANAVSKSWSLSEA